MKKLLVVIAVLILIACGDTTVDFRAVIRYVEPQDKGCNVGYVFAASRSVHASVYASQQHYCDELANNIGEIYLLTFDSQRNLITMRKEER